MTREGRHCAELQFEALQTEIAGQFDQYYVVRTTKYTFFFLPLSQELVVGISS